MTPSELADRLDAAQYPYHADAAAMLREAERLITQASGFAYLFLDNANDYVDWLNGA